MLSKKNYYYGKESNCSVLILVLMEYALEVVAIPKIRRDREVLILVLMEYALEGTKFFNNNTCLVRLNPCFNGICSRRYLLKT